MYTLDPSVSSPSLDALQAKPSLAVVGAGLAGLSAAWLLKDKYQVTLFEYHDSPGMGVFTSDYHSNGIETRIDMPLRIFTKGYYPQLFALYKYLNIEMESSDHAAAYQTWRPEDERPAVFFQYRNINVLGKGFRYLSRNSISGAGFKLVMGQFKFFKQAKKDMANPLHSLSHITFGTYLQQNNFNARFIHQLLLPALAVICTCDYDGILNYPADLILGYLTCGVMNDGIVRAKQGVDGIVPKITQGYDVLCGEQVMSVAPLDHDKNRIMLTSCNQATSVVKEYEFDHVVIATQADIAGQILSAAQHKEADVHTQQAKLLTSIPMQFSSMVLHTDTSIVHHQNQASPVSYIVDESLPRPSTSVDLTKAFSTYKDQQPVFQTWNVIKQPKASSIIAQQSFTRPLVTLESRVAVAKLQNLNAHSAIKICGSYMANKIPLLDAAVESSVEIAKQLGCTIPWHKTDCKPRDNLAHDSDSKALPA